VPAVVIGVFPDEIHPARREKHPFGLGAVEAAKFPFQILHALHRIPRLPCRTKRRYASRNRSAHSSTEWGLHAAQAPISEEA